MARIVYILKTTDIYFSNFSLSSIPQLFYIWDKGLSVWGGILGIGLSLIYFCHKEKEDKFKWLDTFSIAILGALTLGNIGAFLDGRNYGNETTLPWGVTIENSIYAVPIHPTQIYAAIYCGLLTFFLMKLSDHEFGKKAGNITLIAIFSFSFFKFLEEFLRGDESISFLGLREGQIYALLAMAMSAILFLVKKAKKHQETPPET